MDDLPTLFQRLNGSRFLSQIKLSKSTWDYLNQKGIPVIMEHADHFIRTRIACYPTPNDGKQTPMKNHPIFIAQHATAFCCRSCAQKWHGIEKNRSMTEEEIAYSLTVIQFWLEQQLESV
jgi:hypothetical protein